MPNVKKHSGEKGYIAERYNPHVDGEKVTIYNAELRPSWTAWARKEQKKYVVICDAHGCAGGATSVPKARVLMKHPEQFCSDCKIPAGVGGSATADLWNPHDSWHNRSSNFARPTLFVDGHSAVLTDTRYTACIRYDPDFYLPARFLQTGGYSGYHLGSGGGSPHHKPWDYWIEEY